MSMPLNQETSPRPLRLWPAVVLAALLVFGRFVLPLILPDARPFGFPIGIVAMLIGAAGGVAIAVWWLFFSRARWRQRLEALAVMVLAIVAVRFVVDESISGVGPFSLYYIFALATVALALVVWAVASPRFSARLRRTSMVIAVLIGCGVWALVRTGGITGTGNFDFHWRWTPSPEERLLASGRDESSAPPVARPVAPTPAPPPAAPTKPTPDDADHATAVKPVAAAKTSDTPATDEGETDLKPAVPTDRAAWPGFRGPRRDGVIKGVSISTDWIASPPSELWRRPIGPAWSSFAVDDDRIYTQEQRGEEEIVSCYRLKTGEPVWRHSDAVRFYESGSGAGPRGTPTVRSGRVYALGATGILNALDADSGAVLWSRNAATDTSVEVPTWGFASSPLVIDGLVIVAVSGQLVAYDVRTGDRQWLGPKGGGGYSSPHLLTIDGVHQILLLRGSRTISVAPADGALLWEHTWTPGAGIVQPALAANGDVLITVADASGLGMRRLAVRKGSSDTASGTPSWSVEERWTSTGLKPYFSDFVVHNGYAFGFDGSILASIDLADGARKWKGGRYGHGQMVLLPDQDLLLVLSEEGELALVNATPDKFTEVARFQALEGKTWNHPVLVGGVLLVRNGEEMAAFRLSSRAPLSSVR